MDVEVEEPHLGVGDPPQRLHIDAHQLQEGDEREAGGQDPRAVPQRLDVIGAEQALAADRGAEDDEDALDQLRLQAGFLGDLLAPRPFPLAREELLDEAEGEPALAAGPLQFLQRVAALAHPRHDPRLRRGGGGPAAAPHRHDLLLRPALQCGRRDAGSTRGLAEGDPLVGRHRPPRLNPPADGPKRQPGAESARRRGGGHESAGIFRRGSPPPSAPAGPAPRPRRCGCGSPPRPAGRRSCRRRPRPCGRA